MCVFVSSMLCSALCRLASSLLLEFVGFQDFLAAGQQELDGKSQCKAQKSGVNLTNSARQVKQQVQLNCTTFSNFLSLFNSLSSILSFDFCLLLRFESRLLRARCIHLSLSATHVKLAARRRKE